MMKAWTVKKPGSLENLQLVDLADPGARCRRDPGGAARHLAELP